MTLSLSICMDLTRAPKHNTCCVVSGSHDLCWKNDIWAGNHMKVQLFIVKVFLETKIPSCFKSSLKKLNLVKDFQFGVSPVNYSDSEPSCTQVSADLIHCLFVCRRGGGGCRRSMKGGKEVQKAGFIKKRTYIHGENLSHDNLYLLELGWMVQWLEKRLLAEEFLVWVPSGTLFVVALC